MSLRDIVNRGFREVVVKPKSEEVKPYMFKEKPEQKIEFQKYPHAPPRRLMDVLRRGHKIPNNKLRLIDHNIGDKRLDAVFGEKVRVSELPLTEQQKLEQQQLAEEQNKLQLENILKGNANLVSLLGTNIPVGSIPVGTIPQVVNTAPPGSAPAGSHIPVGVKVPSWSITEPSDITIKSRDFAGLNSQDLNKLTTSLYINSRKYHTPDLDNVGPGGSFLIGVEGLKKLTRKFVKIKSVFQSLRKDALAGNQYILNITKGAVQYA